MKTVSYIIIVLLIFCCFSFKEFSLKKIETINQENIEKELIKLLNRKGNCTYIYSVSLPSPINDTSLTMTCHLYINGNDDLISFVNSNKKKTIPILLKLIKKDEYDWISNLILYQITSTPAWEMKKFKPNKCDKWRKEQKENDVKYWENKFKS